MSHTLYTADNISVKGHTYSVRVVESLKDSVQECWPDKESGKSWPKLYDGVGSWLDKYQDEIIEEQVVHFDFTLLINGKLKTFGWSFFITQDPDGYELQDWSTWNAIYFLLKSLGYTIESHQAFAQDVARLWIEQIMWVRPTI